MIRVRDTWMIEDVYDLDEASDWMPAPEVRALAPRGVPESRGFRSLLDDPETCWRWQST